MSHHATCQDGQWGQQAEGMAPERPLLRRPGNRAVRPSGRQGHGDLAGTGLAIKPIGRIPTLRSVGPGRVINEVLGKLPRALGMFGFIPYSQRGCLCFSFLWGVGRG